MIGATPSKRDAGRTRARGRMTSLALACGLSGALLAAPRALAAQRQLEPLRVRSSMGGALMVSRDQVGRLGYDAFGIVASGQFGYALLPWLEPQLAVAASAFPAPGRTGGLMAPMLGVLLGLPTGSIRPYVHLDAGPGFTGALIRPLFRAGVGVDFRISAAFRLGPLLGYGHLFHPDVVGNSSDARYLSLGVSVLFHPVAVPHAKPARRVIYERVLQERVSAPPPPTPPHEPSEEMTVLLENALPRKQVELLAPVLFEFDSDALEPVGVAMLHEVARELERRPDIELIEIQGYADNRGSTEHNVDLAARRAARVLQWLVEHGVDPNRLQVAARGAVDFVETQDDELSHEQNRRVVFRVLRTREEP